jgi:hypothetical protein
LRAGHAQRRAGFITHHQPAGEHPPEDAVLVQHPGFDLEMRGLAIEVLGDAELHFLPIALVHAVEPFLRTVADLRVEETEHRLPARGKVDGVVAQIPVPESVIGAAGRQRVAFLAGPQRLFSAHVRQVGAHPRQRHRKIDGLGQVVIGPELEPPDHVFALIACGHHDDGKAYGRIRAADLDQRIEPGDVGHLDVEQDQIHCLVPDPVEQPACAGGDADRVAVPRESPGKDFTIVFVVVDNEHPSEMGAHTTPLAMSSVSIFCVRRENSTGLVS